jgi:hypothetical protein
VFINFAFLTFLPLPFERAAIAAAAAAASARSCDDYDAESPVSRLTLLGRRDSLLGSLLSVEPLAERNPELFSSLELSLLKGSLTLDVLDSWLNAGSCVSSTSCVSRWL